MIEFIVDDGFQKSHIYPRKPGWLQPVDDFIRDRDWHPPDFHFGDWTEGKSDARHTA